MMGIRIHKGVEHYAITREAYEDKGLPGSPILFPAPLMVVGH